MKFGVPGAMFRLLQPPYPPTRQPPRQQNFTIGKLLNNLRYSMFFFLLRHKMRMQLGKYWVQREIKTSIKTSIKNCFFVILLKYFSKSFRFLKEFYRLASIQPIFIEIYPIFLLFSSFKLAKSFLRLFSNHFIIE